MYFTKLSHKVRADLNSKVQHQNVVTAILKRPISYSDRKKTSNYRTSSRLHRSWNVKSIAADVKPVPPFEFKPLSSANLENEKKWLAAMITTWLDEEWTPLQVHKELGSCTAQAYCKIRSSGETDASAILLAICNDLLKFNYRETFTDAFEVGNKAIEMLMMAEGCDVCCTSSEDAGRLERHKHLLL